MLIKRKAESLEGAQTLDALQIVPVRHPIGHDPFHCCILRYGYSDGTLPLGGAETVTSWDNPRSVKARYNCRWHEKLFSYFFYMPCTFLFWSARCMFMIKLTAGPLEQL
jgi:hypothetical protein